MFVAAATLTRRVKIIGTGNNLSGREPLILHLVGHSIEILSFRNTAYRSLRHDEDQRPLPVASRQGSASRGTCRSSRAAEVRLAEHTRRLPPLKRARRNKPVVRRPNHDSRQFFAKTRGQFARSGGVDKV